MDVFSHYFVFIFLVSYMYFTSFSFHVLAAVFSYLKIVDSQSLHSCLQMANKIKSCFKFQLNEHREAQNCHHFTSDQTFIVKEKPLKVTLLFKGFFCLTDGISHNSEAMTSLQIRIADLLLKFLSS